MHVAIWLVALVGTVIAATALANRIGAAAPLLLVVVGVVASYIPQVPDFPLEPDLVLLGLLPPLLYATAIRGSIVDLKADARNIGLLSVGLVLFTAFGVGLVVWWLIDVPFAAALALGAVVAPPDAVAASAVGRRIGLPRRVLTLLEGESLFNDATAIVLLRTAIAAIAGSVTMLEVGRDFLISAVGGLAVGGLVAWLVTLVHRQLHDPALATGLSLLTPWLAYLPAEEIHASGVVAVVICGLIVGHRAPLDQTALTRVSQNINWVTVQFLLENAVFLLIGLQMRRIVSDVSESELGWGTIAGVCAVVLGSVIALRFIWVAAVGLKAHRGASSDPLSAPSSEAGPLPVRHIVLLGWAGMRGVVTLAAVFILPEETPHRDVLVLAAMTVAAGTLLIQGSTLPLLARTLRIEGPDQRSDALQRAVVMRSALAAGVKVLDEFEANPDSGVDAVVFEDLRRRSEFRSNAHWERFGPETASTPDAQYRRVRQAMIAAERTEVLRLRNLGNGDHEVLQEVLFSLDVEESQLEIGNGEAIEHSAVADLLAPPRVSDECEELQLARHCAEPQDDHCRECAAAGEVSVALRICMNCGYVACCDSSPGQHATAHFHESGHPVIRSFEPGEKWRWCYVHESLG